MQKLILGQAFKGVKQPHFLRSNKDRLRIEACKGAPLCAPLLSPQEVRKGSHGGTPIQVLIGFRNSLAGLSTQLDDAVQVSRRLHLKFGVNRAVTIENRISHEARD